MMSRVALAAAAFVIVRAEDPAGSWLSYARWDAPNNGAITSLNTTWTVPPLPASSFGSNAPGWWFGVMDKDGDGALVQPILAYGYQGSHYTIFNGVFDWTDGSWHTSPEKYSVQPGDTISSSVTYNKAADSYTMRISSLQLGKTITTDYAIERRQSEPESSAVFVLEHQPLRCKAYPTSGTMSFENIYLEVDGKAVVGPKWSALQEQPACDSKAVIVDSQTIQFTWDTSSASTGVVEGQQKRPAPAKWGHDLPAVSSGVAPDASEICVANQAGFVLHWELHDILGEMASADSGSYPIDQTRCLPLSAIPDIKEGAVVMCKVHAELGETQFCASAVRYSANSTSTATFTCTGTTLDYSCTLNGGA